MTLAPIVKSRDLFVSLGNEEEQEHNEFQIQEGQYPRWMFEGLLEILSRKDSVDRSSRHAEVIAAKYNVFAKDIEEFSKTLIGSSVHRAHQSHRVGTYLSALISRSKDEEVVIHTGTGEIVHQPAFLGYNQGSHKLLVYGDVGNCLGHFLGPSSQIILNGNSGDLVGSCMIGGLIKLKGNTGRYLGSEMMGGRIKVYGEAKEDIGRDMRNGEISIVNNMREREVRELLSPYIRGGSVYHNGNPIVLEGRRVE